METNDNSHLIVSSAHPAAQTVAFMCGQSQVGSLGQQNLVRISLYLAQRGLSVFSIASLRECGRSAGMNGAEMTENQKGTSHDAKATVCLRFVQAIVDEIPLPGNALESMYDVGFSQEAVLEVVAQISLHKLLANMNMVIAAPGEILNFSQEDSPSLQVA